MKSAERKTILKTLHNKIARGEPVIAGGAGWGIIAKMQEAAGIDLIMAYNTGPYRMDGNPSLIGHMPYGNCNEVTLDLLKKYTTAVQHTPVVAGVGAADPLLDIRTHLRLLKKYGASGVTNVPTVGGRTHGGLRGPVREELERSGFGFGKEMDMLKYCRTQDVLTVAYAFEEEQIRRLVGEVGVDIIAPHVGGTAGGVTGFKSESIEEASERIGEMFEIAIKENPEVIVLCHGGPLKDPLSVQRCLDLTGVHGFIGASTIERIPVENSLFRIMSDFKNVKVPEGRM